MQVKFPSYKKKLLKVIIMCGIVYLYYANKIKNPRLLGNYSESLFLLKNPYF